MTTGDESPNEPAPTQFSLPGFVPPSDGEQIISQATGNTYTIGHKVADGFYGDVYHCDDSWGEQLVAKVLKPVGSSDQTRLNAIYELQRLRDLRHPQITYLYDAFEFRGACYLIMERCGMTVESLIEIQDFNGMLWLEPMARCLLRAVQWIHLNGFVHQDIHTRNVLVAFARDELSPASLGSLSFKVADLGLAKLAHEINVQTDVLNESIRAPEAINPSEFGPADKRMDIYHCALLLLQVIKGQKLSFTRDEVLAGIPRQMALGLDAPYKFGLEKALRRHVQWRTASAEELWRDLKSPGGFA